jgi:hypothetical protein
MPPDCVQPAPWASRSSDRASRPSSRPAVQTDAAPHRTPEALAKLRLLQSLTTGCHHAPKARVAWFLPGLSSPSTLPARGSHVRYAGLATTRLRSASRVSHPPDGLTPPRTLPACFIRLTFLGFRPPEPSSSAGAVAPLGARCRPVVHRGPSSPREPDHRPAPAPSPCSVHGLADISRVRWPAPDPRPDFTALLP